jgi:hypothetical protein
MTGYSQNNATLVSYDPGKARNDSQGQIAHTRVSLTSSRLQELLIGQLLRNDASASKTRHLEKFKINISTCRIQTKFCTRKRLNTKSILHI